MIYIHIPWDFWYSTPSCSLLCLLLPPLLHEYNKIKNSTSLELSNFFPPALRFCLDCFGISSVRRLRIWYLKTGCLRRCLHPIYGMVSTREQGSENAQFASQEWKYLLHLRFSQGNDAPYYDHSILYNIFGKSNLPNHHPYATIFQWFYASVVMDQL